MPRKTEWCTCSACLLAGPRGIAQFHRTAQSHRDQDSVSNDGANLSTSAAPFEPTDATQAFGVTSRGQTPPSIGNSPYPSIGGDVQVPQDQCHEESEVSDDDGIGTSMNDANEVPVLESASDSDTSSLFNRFSHHDFSAEAEIGDFDSDSDDSNHILGEEEGISVEHLQDDPLFIRNARIFDPYRLGKPDDCVDDDAEVCPDIPYGLTVHPSIRHALIRAITASYFHGATKEGVKHMLDGSFCLLSSTQNAAPEVQYHGLEMMARTLLTAEKHLGISFEGFITYFFVCDSCWELHKPAELYNLDTPECQELDCEGTLYSVKRLSDGTEKRRPTKIMPFVDPEKAIQHMLLRPGKLAQINEWRRPGDEPRRVAPTTAKGYEAFPDPSVPIRDGPDGWEWRTIRAGLERRRTGAWSIEDVDVHEIHQRFVSLPCGLVWQINIDWCVSYNKRMCTFNTLISKVSISGSWQSFDGGTLHDPFQQPS
jgi:hypothetical protein